MKEVLALQDAGLLAHGHLVEADGARVVVARAALPEVVARDDDERQRGDDVLGRALLLRTRVVQARQDADEARHAKTKHGDHEDGHDARQTDLDVVDDEQRHAQLVHRRPFRVPAAQVVVREEPHVAGDEPNEAERVDHVLQVGHEGRLVGPLVQPRLNHTTMHRAHMTVSTGGKIPREGRSGALP